MTQQMEEIDKKNKFLDENGCWVHQKTPKSQTNNSKKEINMKKKFHPKSETPPAYIFQFALLFCFFYKSLRCFFFLSPIFI